MVHAQYHTGYPFKCVRMRVVTPIHHPMVLSPLHRCTSYGYTDNFEEKLSLWERGSIWNPRMNPDDWSPDTTLSNLLDHLCEGLTNTRQFCEEYKNERDSFAQVSIPMWLDNWYVDDDIFLTRAPLSISLSASSRLPLLSLSSPPSAPPLSLPSSPLLSPSLSLFPSSLSVSLFSFPASHNFQGRGRKNVRGCLQIGPLGQT